MGCLAPVVHAAAGERHCACRAGVGPVCHQLIRAHPSASLASEPGALGGPCRSGASTCSPTAAAALENAARGRFSVTRPKAAAKADEWIYVLAGSEAGFGSALANEPSSNSSATARSLVHVANSALPIPESRRRSGHRQPEPARPHSPSLHGPVFYNSGIFKPSFFKIVFLLS